MIDDHRISGRKVAVFENRARAREERGFGPGGLLK